jgi:hypothetical protein
MLWEIARAVYSGSPLFDLQILWYIAWSLAEPSCAQTKLGSSQILTVRALSFQRYPMPGVTLLILKAFSSLPAWNSFGVGSLNAMLLQD